MSRLKSNRFTLVGLCFGLSGVAALIYQVTWQRILALHSGVGVYSVAMIVAAFMAGLGLGSYWGGRLSTRLSPRGALAAFSALEIAIGLFAASSATLYYDFLYLKVSALYTPAWRAGLLHFAALVFPTTLMGMSLPFLTRATVADAPTAGRTIGTLYALNVVGASLGALATPWLLVRHFGIRGAIFFGVLANLLAGFGALALVRGTPASVETPLPSSTSLSSRRSFTLWIALYAASGFCALSLEIVWFRVVDVAVHSTAFTFGSVLFIYLLGLALGSLAGARVVHRVRDALRAFLTCQCAILAYAALGLFALTTPPRGFPGYRWFYDYWSTGTFVIGTAWDPDAVLRLYVLLPAGLYAVPTFLMGFSFALLQKAVQDDPRNAGRKVGTLQAANIAGNVTGSLLVGIVALSTIGTTGTVRTLLVFGVAFALLGVLRYGWRSGFSFALFLLVALAFFVPRGSTLWSRLHGVDRGSALIEEDASSVVALKPEGSGWRVLVNGHRHSWIPFGGVHSWLGSLPALLHPSPRRIAVIGLGSGDTAWAAACRDKTVDVSVFEIAAPQERLLKRYASMNVEPQLERFLHDPRVRIRAADGRIALFTDDVLYDVIVVDALRPTSAYSGNLYSVEFFERCARKLKPGGLMSTWVPTPRVNATFRKAFPYSVNVMNGVILIGSIHPIPIEPRLWQARLSDPAVREYLGERLTDEIEASFAGIRPTLGRNVPETDVNRDLFPKDEFLLPR